MDCLKIYLLASETLPLLRTLPQLLKGAALLENDHECIRELALLDRYLFAAYGSPATERAAIRPDVADIEYASWLPDPGALEVASWATNMRSTVR
jgi:hypothetical protein